MKIVVAMFALLCSAASFASTPSFEEKSSNRASSSSETLLTIEVAARPGMYTVSIDKGGAEESQPSPALFRLPDTTALVRGRVWRKLNDGTLREHKFSVRVERFHETTLSMKYIGPGAGQPGTNASTGTNTAAPKPPAVQDMMFGQVSNCFHGDMRAEFVRDNQVVTLEAPANDVSKQIQLAKGTYVVRLHTKTSDGTYKFQTRMDSFEVPTDGWNLPAWCSPAQLAQPFYGLKKQGNLQGCRQGPFQSHLEFWRQNKLVQGFMVEPGRQLAVKLPSGSYEVRWRLAQTPPPADRPGMAPVQHIRMRPPGASQGVYPEPLLVKDNWVLPTVDVCR